VVSWKHAPPKRKRLLFEIESLGMLAQCIVAVRRADHGLCNVGVVSWKHAPPKRKRLFKEIKSLRMPA
jgi:hypothetical protein